MKDERILRLINSKQIIKVSSDKNRALSLIESSENTSEVALAIDINEKSATTIFRESYEAIRQMGDALWWMEGYNPQNHDVSMEILKDLNFLTSEQKVKLNSLDRFKSIRHGANYKGFKISVEQAREIIEFWKFVAKDILKYLKQELNPRIMFDIPFYKQIEKNDCGPVALKMVLEYPGEKHSIDKLKKLIEPEESGATWSIAIAKSSAELGFKTEFYTKSLGFNPENYKLDFYKRETNLEKAEEKEERFKKECVKYGVKLNEKKIELKEILNKLNENCLAIILIDWGKIKGSDKFVGHFVPIVGYDEKNVYVHNQGLNNPQPNLAISRELFESARKSVGTDEDIIFIRRK